MGNRLDHTLMSCLFVENAVNKQKYNDRIPDLDDQDLAHYRRHIRSHSENNQPHSLTLPSAAA